MAENQAARTHGDRTSLPTAIDARKNIQHDSRQLISAHKCGSLSTQNELQRGTDLFRVWAEAALDEFRRIIYTLHTY